MNQKDKIGNTPLHYAVLNWNEEFVEMLLALGANASVQNKNGDIPLSRIRKSTLENFMNKECIIVKGFDQRDDKIEEDSDDDANWRTPERPACAGVGPDDDDKESELLYLKWL